MYDHYYGRSRKSRTAVLQALHEKIENCSSVLEIVVMKEHKAATKVNRKFVNKFLIGFFIADVPEAEDLLGVERGIKKFFSRHTCYARREKVLSFPQFHKRSTMFTVQLVQSLQCNERRSEVEEKLRNNSKLPVLPALSSFPFVGIHRLVELYSLFRVD